MVVVEDVVWEELRRINIELDVWAVLAAIPGFLEAATIVQPHEGLHEVIQGG